MKSKKKLTLPPKQSGKHSIHHHGEVYINPEIMSGMADSTQIQNTQIEKRKDITPLTVQWKHTQLNAWNMRENTWNGCT